MKLIIELKGIWSSKPAKGVSLVILALATLFLTLSANGQAGGGQIAGTVTDSSGAAIDGAKVSAVDEKTGSVYTSVTASAGSFQFPSLVVGTYTVTASAPSFQVAKSTGVVVELGSTSSVKITLHPGSTKETVTVTANALTPQTESVDTSTILPPEMAEQLPLAVGNGAMRNAGDFVFLTPGTSGGVGTTGVVWEDRIGGGQGDGSEVLVDGATAVTVDFGDASTSELLPSIDAVEEFNVSIAGMAPQFGHTTGAIQSYTTKSGTNTIHGTAYEIFRNTALDANGWFQDAYDQPKTPDMRNEFGVTFGAPVRIPHVYDGRNKTFLFFSWEQFRQRGGQFITETVPTAANRTGDFSAFLGASLGVDPCGQTYYVGEIFDPTTSFTGAGGATCRKPFSYNGKLNVMDPTLITTVAKNVLAFVPQPSNSALQNNYLYSSSYPLVDTAETIRVDQSFSDRDKLFVSYNPRENLRDNVNANFSGPISSSSSTQDLFTHMTRIGETHEFRSNMVNQATLGYMRIWNDVTFPAAGQDYLSSLGITGINANGFPSINYASQQAGNTTIGDASVESLVVNNMWNLTDSISKTFGNHSLTFGADLRYYQTSLIDGNGPGSFNFGNGETADTPSVIGNTGNGFASFLLGDLSSASYSIHVRQPKNIGYYEAFYAMDSMKVSSNLQLLYGFRYDIDVPVRESADDRANFSPTALNPAAGDIPGALIFAGTGPGRTGQSSRFANTWFKDIAPRLGITYSPAFLHQKTVLRASFSTIYGPLLASDTGLGTGPGFTPTATLTDQSSGGYISPANFNSPFTPLVDVINTDPTQANGGGPVTTLPSFGRPSATQLWSFDAQNQLASNLMVTLSYIGSRSTHLHSDVLYPNSIKPNNYALGNALNETVTGGPYSGFSGTLAQSLRPFPQYGALDTLDGQEDYGQGNYEAFIAKIQRRFQNGFSLLGSYTLSKLLTDADYFSAGVEPWGSSIQNPFNLKNDKSVSTSDIPNMVMLNYIYELPFGHNKPFLNSNSVENYVVGGWQIAGIHRYFEGQPNQLSCTNGIPGADTCIRFDYVPAQPVASASVRNKTFNPLTDLYLNDAAFVDQNVNVPTTPGEAYQLGNVPRTLNGYLGARLPTFYDEDFSIVKRFPFIREQNIEFRAEMFNAFNRHIWGGPNGNPYNAASFGQVTGTASTSRQVQFQLRIHY
jgi:Carboxypeptidase regulatory-like domain